MGGLNHLQMVGFIVVYYGLIWFAMGVLLSTISGLPSITYNYIFLNFVWDLVHLGTYINLPLAIDAQSASCADVFRSPQDFIRIAQSDVRSCRSPMESFTEFLGIQSSSIIIHVHGIFHDMNHPFWIPPRLWKPPMFQLRRFRRRCPTLSFGGYPESSWQGITLPSTNWHAKIPNVWNAHSIIRKVTNIPCDFHLNVKSTRKFSHEVPLKNPVKSPMHSRSN